MKKSEPATASSSTIARIGAVRRPGRSLDIEASVGGPLVRCAAGAENGLGDGPISAGSVARLLSASAGATDPTYRSMARGSLVGLVMVLVLSLLVLMHQPAVWLGVQLIVARVAFIPLGRALQLIGAEEPPRRPAVASSPLRSRLPFGADRRRRRFARFPSRGPPPLHRRPHPGRSVAVAPV